MVDLPQPIPARIARLPRDKRGYPIPRFVDRRADRDDGADFRYANYAFRRDAFKRSLCWVCGDVLGRHRVFVLGPMCTVNRATVEPPCHRECAEWSAKACPFLSRPKMRRNEQGMDVEAAWKATPGLGISRNPGCVALYETNDYRPEDDMKGSWIIRLGPPQRIDWIAEGRAATRAEIEASILSGLPLLRTADEDPEAAAELDRMIEAAWPLLPAA